MGRKPDREKPGFAKRVITDKAAYNQYMRDYRARKARERAASAGGGRPEGEDDAE